MANRKKIASDIYFELKGLESQMRQLLVKFSLSHPEYVKVYKAWRKKREKWWPMIQQELVFPEKEVDYPVVACSLCRSVEYWESQFGSVICMQCHPPGSPASVVRIIVVKLPKTP